MSGIALDRSRWTTLRRWLSDHFLEIGILVYVALSLQYVLHCAMVSDDAIYFYVRGIMAERGIDLPHLLWQTFLEWMKRGRFYPLWGYMQVFFYFVEDNTLYKSLQILAVVADVALFGHWVLQVTGSRKVRLAAMAGMTLFFQVNTAYNSSILAFAALVPIMVGVLLLMLITLHRYLHGGGRRFLWAGVLLFAAALMTYEISFVFFPVVVAYLLCYRRRFVDVLRPALLYAVPVGLVGVANVAVKVLNPVDYEGIRPSLHLSALFATALKQAVAAVPNAAFLNIFGYRIRSGSLVEGLLANVWWTDAGLAVLLVAFFAWLLRTATSTPIDPRFLSLRFGLLGLVFWIGPALLIGLSAKYQQELTWGLGHVPVYISFFGLALFLLWAALYARKVLLRERLPKVVRGAAAALFLLFVAVTVLANQQSARLTIDDTNLAWLYPRDAAMAALRGGILDDVAAEDDVEVVRQDAWTSTAFLTQFAGRVVRSRPTGTWQAADADEYAGSGALPGITVGTSGNRTTTRTAHDFCFDYEADATSGWAASAHLVAVETAPGSTFPFARLVDRVEVFVLPSRPTLLGLRYTCLEPGGRLADVDIPLSGLTVLGRTADGVLYALDETRPVIFESLALTASIAATTHYRDVDVTYGSGVHVLETGADYDSWRWCAQLADVRLDHRSQAAGTFSISFSATAVPGGSGSLQVLVDGEVLADVPFDDTSKGVSFEVVLPPGTTTIRLLTDAPAVVSATDLRDMRYMLRDFVVRRVTVAAP
jgi:hypothetical protein